MAYTEEEYNLFEKVLERIENGESLNKILRGSDQTMSTRMFYRLVSTNESLREKYARAKDIKIEHKFESIEQDYMSDPERDPETGKIDPAWVNLQRLKIDAKKWELSKLAPKKYGDKLDIDHTSGGEKLEPTRIVFGGKK